LWGYLDHDGAVVIAPRFERADFFYENMAAVRLGGRWGFIDPRGRVVIAPTFSDARRFSDGVAYIRVDSPNSQRDMSGYIDKMGQVVITCSPGNADERLTEHCGTEFSEGRVGEVVETFRCVDEAGNPVAGEYPCRAIFVDRWGYYDKAGMLATPGPFHSGGSQFSEGLAAAQPYHTTLMGFIDRSGRFAIEPEFDRAEAFSDGLAAVRVSGQWGFIDRTGRFVIEPQFRSVTRFSDGYATIRVDGKAGYINATGQIVIPPRFDEAAAFSEGLAAVCCDSGRTGYIDKMGRWAIPAHFERGTGNASPFSQGVALAKVGEREAVYINRMGEVIAPLRDR